MSFSTNEKILRALADKPPITVLATEIEAALELAAERDSSWQAGLLEILLIPAVHQRWVDANWAGLQLFRVDGRPWKGRTPELNQVETDWLQWAGYELRVTEFTWWNRRRDDHYGHSAAVAWDGVRRETYCSFIEDLRNIYLHDHKRCNCTALYLETAQDKLQDYRIRYLRNTGAMRSAAMSPSPRNGIRRPADARCHL